MTPGAAVVLLLLLLIPALISAHLRKKAQQKEAGAGTGRWKKMDVTAIRLALDWRSRPKIQAALKRLAREGESGSPEGRRRLLSATVSLLQEESSAWLYAGASDYSPMSPPQAEGIFRQLAIDARSRFKEEVIRDAEGRREEREASPLRARPQEGEGVVVITLIVAARRELKDLGSRHDAQELRRALQRLKKLHPGELVALEVVWSPAEEEDRMSTLELEALYPEMSLIHPGSVAGRVSCGSCGGPYPAELRRCPHCGAPGGASGGERS